MVSSSFILALFMLPKSILDQGQPYCIFDRFQREILCLLLGHHLSAGAFYFDLEWILFYFFPVLLFIFHKMHISTYNDISSVRLRNVVSLGKRAITHKYSIFCLLIQRISLILWCISKAQASKHWDFSN